MNIHNSAFFSFNLLLLSMEDQHCQAERVIVDLEGLLADDLDPVPLPDRGVPVQVALPEEHHLLLVVPERAVEPVHDDHLLHQGSISCSGTNINQKEGILSSK